VYPLGALPKTLSAASSFFEPFMSCNMTKGDGYGYRFTFNGQTVRQTTKQGNKCVAEQVEAARKTRLAKGIEERKKIPAIAKFASQFTDTIETECAEKPATALSSVPLDRIGEALI
jgi:hypothetical protein